MRHNNVILSNLLGQKRSFQDIEWTLASSRPDKGIVGIYGGRTEVRKIPRADHCRKLGTERDHALRKMTLSSKCPCMIFMKPIIL